MDLLLLEDEILQLYSAADLAEIFRIYFSDFLTKNPDIINEWGLDSREFTGVSVRKKLSAKVFAIVISDQKCLQQWLKTIPSDIYQSLSLIAWEGRQSVDRIEKETDCSVLVSHRKNNDERFFSLQPAYRLFLVDRQELMTKVQKESIYIHLPSKICAALKKQFAPPVGYELLPIKMPDNISFTFFDKGLLLSKILLFQSLMDHESIKTNRRGELTQKSLKDISKRMDLEEFYPESSGSELNNLRLRLIFHLYKMISIDSQEDNPLDALKEKFKKYLKNNTYPHISLLNHATGWQFAQSAMNHGVHANVCRIIRELPEGEWFDLHQLVRYAKLRGVPLSPISIDQAQRYLRVPLDWDGWGNTKKPIVPEIYEQVITLPAVKSNMFVLAAFGLLDIAYEMPENKDLQYKDKVYLSIFDGLHLIRLSKLGAYVLGQSDAYTQQYQAENKASIVLDSQQLLVIVTAVDPRLEYGIGKIAKKVGRLHYIVDFTTFFKECRSMRDVQVKVNWLKKQTGSTIPDNWKLFFDQLKARIDVLEPKPELSVYKISKKNTELMHFVTTDEDINRYIKKAENYHLVISNNDLAKVKDRIRKFGFLL